MTDPAPNSMTVDLVLTGSADQLLAAKTAILALEENYPGMTLSGQIGITISDVQYVGKDPLMMTIEDLLEFDGQGSEPNGSERARNCLRRVQILTVGQLIEKTEDDLLAITNFGQKSLDFVNEKLSEHGLELKRGR